MFPCFGSRKPWKKTIKTIETIIFKLSPDGGVALGDNLKSWFFYVFFGFSYVLGSLCVMFIGFSIVLGSLVVILIGFSNILGSLCAIFLGFGMFATSNPLPQGTPQMHS